MATERLRIELRLSGETVAVEGRSPTGPARFDEALPLFRELDDAVINRAIAKVEAQGEKVTCSKGCSACCRAQPVPVTPPEAYALLKLVEELPEPRRSQVRAEFADRFDQLRSAGLDRAFLDRDPNMTRESARAMAQRYFDLHLACPFLVDDACGIYEQRPFVCRQYLVTTPVELCADPLHQPVRPVPMPVHFASATLNVAERLWGARQHTVPLTLALEFAERHREQLEQRFDGQTLATQLRKELANA